MKILFLVVGMVSLSLSMVTSDDKEASSEVGEQASAQSKNVAEGDQPLRPDKFARYEKLPDMEDAGKGYYRALYRLPKTVYAPQYASQQLPPVRKWLEAEGIEFGPQSSVQFYEGTRVLEVIETVPQLTRVELVLARFGGKPVLSISAEVFDVPLFEGWRMIESAVGLDEHSSIRKQALHLVKKGEGKIVEAFSTFSLNGERGKFERLIKQGEDLSSDPIIATYFEFDAVGGPTGIDNAGKPAIDVNFAFERNRGEYSPRKIHTVVAFESQSGVIAGSWREGARLQFLFIGGEIKMVNGVTRVREVTAK